MGYDTKFKGVLKFTSEITGPQLAMLAKILKEDLREHPEWFKMLPEYVNPVDICYIDLVVTDDYLGLKWDDETEKTRGLVEAVNLVVTYMRTKFPQFGLEGKLAAQGEEIDDRWTLVMVNGKAVKQIASITGTIVVCPHCEEKFVLEDAAKVEPTRRRR